MGEVGPGKYIVRAGWDDVPHLDEETKKELYESTPPYLRDARARGEPGLGAGAIYPLAIEEIQCAPMPIPPYWPRCYALDPAWNRTAALWGALDRENDTWYLYTEHYRGQAEPSIHATAIKARGEWIPGIIDPAARGRSQEDGKRLIDSYRNLGLKLTEAKNAVDAGLWEVWERLSTGRLKAFSSLQKFEAEYRLYRRDEDGKVVKKDDHLMDCMRYLVMTGKGVAKVKPVERKLMGAGSAAGGDPIVNY